MTTQSSPSAPHSSQQPVRGEASQLQTHAVLHELSITPDPLALFSLLTNDGTRPHALLLESAEPSSRKTQRSILFPSCALSIVCRGASITLTALNDEGQALLKPLKNILNKYTPTLENATLHLNITTSTQTHCNERERLKSDSSLSVLREISLALQKELPHIPQAVFLAGLFAYDLVEQFEPLPEIKTENNCPDYQFYLADQAIIIDHLQGVTQVINCTFSANDEAKSHEELHARQHALTQLIHTIPPASPHTPSDIKQAALAAGRVAFDDVQIDTSDEVFIKQVTALKQHIMNGDVFQIVLSRTFSMPCHDAFSAYRVLRQLNPSPYLFYMHSSDFTLLGASPESAVKVNGATRQIEISPIAGTRRRGLTAEGLLDADLDSRIEAEFRLDEKENAEHMMLVDLARNDVARVSKTGTRHVANLMRTERYSHVMHLVSRVVGTLCDDLDALHAYQASMNMGTLTGAPKVRAMQLLRQYEGKHRAHYGGAIGYLRGDGSFDTAIVIRSALVQDGMAYIRAGAGIVHDSIPELEAEETKRKAESVLRAIAVSEKNIQK